MVNSAPEPRAVLTHRDLILNPGLVLSEAELAAGRANVEEAPPLSPAQIDRISAVFRPITRRLAAGEAV